MRMGHLCFPLREMNGTFAFACLGLRIFPGNYYQLKFASVLGTGLAQNKGLLQFTRGHCSVYGLGCELAIQ